MTMFLELKEKLKAIYAEYGTYILPAAKFLLALAVFLNINHTLDYVPALGSIFVVLILSLICAIIPLNGTVFFAMVLILLQCTGVHILAAAFGAVLFLTLWVLYLRFASGEALALVLTPLAFALNIPAAVPIAFGLVSGPVSALSMACGLIVYYFMNLIQKRIAVLAAGEDLNMLDLVTALAEGIFQNEELLVAVICCTVTLLVVYLIRSLEADYAWEVSVVAGGIAYLVIQLAGALFLEVPVSVPVLVIGTVGACLICYVLQLFVFGGDYSRSKMFRFQDDEYYYYVKAVPKMAVANPDRTIKNISEEELKEEVPEETEVLKNYEISRKEPEEQTVEIPRDIIQARGESPEQDMEPAFDRIVEEVSAEDAAEKIETEPEMDLEMNEDYFESVDFEEKLTDTLKNL
ncbi:MAG: hypothetical protein KH281_07660 [Lachnospiraceae bacterium]|nr:hypothetical protein [Lachnospiraceae bacterium]